jgi:hypothetical protein
MPIVEDIYMYTYETFDRIKPQLLPKVFVTHVNDMIENSDSSYVGEDSYSYLKYLDIPDREGYEKGSKFEYKINSDYFRNDHFTKLDPKVHNVLAAGCSFTFGHGLPEEKTWPKIFEKLAIDQQNNIKTVNLGSPGISISSAINNIMSFIKRYGPPQTILALFPAISREVVFHPKAKEYQTYSPAIRHLENKKRDPYYFFKTKNYIFEDSLYSAINEIRLFEEFCNAAGIRLIWSTWLLSDLMIYKELEFNSFVSNQDFHFDSDEGVLHPGEYSEYSSVARDSCHPGINYSTKAAKAFFNVWKDKNV